MVHMYQTEGGGGKVSRIGHAIPILEVRYHMRCGSCESVLLPSLLLSRHAGIVSLQEASAYPKRSQCKYIDPPILLVA